MLAIFFMSIGFLVPKDIYMIWLSILLTLKVIPEMCLYTELEIYDFIVLYFM